MIDIQISEKFFWENEVEGYIFLLKENWQESDEIKKIEQYYPNLKQVLLKHKFEGKIEDSFLLTINKDKKLIQLIFVGIGKLDGSWNTELENLRRAIGISVKLIKKYEINESVINIVHEKIYDQDFDQIIKQVVIAATLADYEFTKFKSDKKGKEEIKLFICPGQESKKSFVQNLNIGSIIGQATNFARTLCDLPANILTPKVLAEKAKQIADEEGISYKIFGQKKAQELGMGGFLAVDSGSEQDGQFIVLEYSTVKKDAPTIALVGKGVTFDTGGVSLKPSSAMTGMKFDMSGAAAVISTMKAICKLKPDVNVVAIAPAVENMPSGKACRQDDIITFMNGKTAEIKNTDAEGRLILADALCYAEKFYNPDVIIDLATLTGACVVALGHFFTALMTKDENLKSQLQRFGWITGDRVWPLPLYDDYKQAIKSEVADIANTGLRKYGAGTITAGFFLSNFVEKSKWAHLDIAGTADGVPGISYLNSHGSAGAGVRLLIEFILNYKKNA